MAPKYVRISSFTDASEAEICKGKLTAHGIECYLENEKIIGATGFDNAFGGINLLVDENKVDEAKKLLNL